MADTRSNPSNQATADYTQARIRINEDGALVLEQLLLAEERRLIVERDQNPETERVEAQRKLRAVRRVMDELYRAMDDRGWA